MIETFKTSKKRDDGKRKSVVVIQDKSFLGVNNEGLSKSKSIKDQPNMSLNNTRNKEILSSRNGL